MHAFLDFILYISAECKFCYLNAFITITIIYSIKWKSIGETNFMHLGLLNTHRKYHEYGTVYEKI